MNISQVQLSQGINLSDIKDILGKLKVGDAVKAQVLEFTANELVLKLFDGKTVTASTTSPVDAKPGDIVDFTVKAKNENQIILEPSKKLAPKDTDSDLPIKKQLLTMEIIPEEKNLEIAKEIQKYSLPLNKDTFKNITDLLSKFKNLTPEKAAFLTASNIEVGEKSINSLNQIVSGKAKISAGITDLTESLLQIDNEDVVNNIAKQLTASDSSRFNDKTGEKPDVEINQMINTKKNTSDERQNSADEKLAGDFTKKIEQSIIKNDTYKQNPILFKDIKESIIKLLNTEAQLPEKIGNDLQKLLSDKLGLTELPAKIKSEINLLLEKMNTKIKEKPQNEDTPVTMHEPQSTEDTGPKNVLRRVLQKLYVKPESETVQEDINVKKLYRDISKAVEIIKENIDKSSIQNKNEIISKIDTLDNNIRFINELNNHNTYIQIPINMRDTNTQGELYILKKDSKRKKIDPENVTMFISLDTVNIGRVDSLIKLDKKNVSINMRVEDKRVFELIKEKYKDLYEVIRENGYKLVNLNYRLIEENPNVMNVESIAKKEDERNRRSIDLRL